MMKCYVLIIPTFTTKNQDNAKFHLACEVVKKRVTATSLDSDKSSDSEDGTSDDDVTVPLVGSPSSVNAVVSQQETSSSNQQAQVKTEEIEVDGSPGIGDGDDQAKTSEKKKRKKGGDGVGKGSKKKKTSTKTPKAKAATSKNGKTLKSQGKGSAASVVTPAPSKINIDKVVSERISPTDEPYSVMTNAAAWKLLESKFGVTYESEKYYLPSQEKPVATTLTGLRKDLCEKGLPEAPSLLPLKRGSALLDGYAMPLFTAW